MTNSFSLRPAGLFEGSQRGTGNPLCNGFLMPSNSISGLGLRTCCRTTGSAGHVASSIRSTSGPGGIDLEHMACLACASKDGLNFDRFYHLRHTHVQFALKLTRMGSVNQRYLKNIMSPFTTKEPALFCHQLRHKYCATPKVVAERFLLQVEREFRWEGHDMAVSNELGLQRICPHMVIMRSFKSAKSTKASQMFGLEGLSNDFHRAVASLGQEFTGHCRRCPTDYTVIAHRGIVTICSWHDLGSYGSPLSEQWTSHIRSDQNGLCKGPHLHHNPGTIRGMYVCTWRDLLMGSGRKCSQFSDGQKRTLGRRSYDY